MDNQIACILKPYRAVTMYTMLSAFTRPSVSLYRLTALDTAASSRAAACCGQQSNEENSHDRCTLKWFNFTKGFDVIAPDVDGKDVFVHISTLEKSGMPSLKDDQTVTFDVEAGRDGRQSAINIAIA